METEDERRARLENDAATKRLRLVMESGEDGSYHTAQVGPGSRGQKKCKNGFDLDIIWIKIGVFKNFKECARSPCNGNHFSSI